MKAVADTSKVYEAELRVHHVKRPGFRITEMQISPTQEVPWHYHNHAQDTLYVVSGAVRIELRDPIEEVRLNSWTGICHRAETTASRNQYRRDVRQLHCPTR